MNKLKAYLRFSLIGLLLSAVAQAQAPTSPNDTDRANALLKQMTTEEKIGQLNQPFYITVPIAGLKKDPVPYEERVRHGRAEGRCAIAIKMRWVLEHGLVEARVPAVEHDQIRRLRLMVTHQSQVVPVEPQIFPLGLHVGFDWRQEPEYRDIVRGGQFDESSDIRITRRVACP